MHKKSSSKSSPQLWPTPQASNPGQGDPHDGKRGKKLEWSVRNSLATSESSMADSLPELTCSQEDFLASLSARPGSAEARRMTAISGLKCCALSQRQDPLGFLERTLLESSAWNSTVCFLTWKVKATPAGRLLFQLAPSMPNTDGTEFGLWPTPEATVVETAGKEDVIITTGQKPRRIVRSGHNASMGLGRMVQLWPTPTSRDHKDGTAKSCQNVDPNGLLGRVVHLFPTTRASDGTKGIRTPEGIAKERLRRSNGQDLGTVVGGSLNPEWVEWLMGYPIGHTALKPSATPLFRKSRTSS